MQPRTLRLEALERGISHPEASALELVRDHRRFALGYVLRLVMIQVGGSLACSLGVLLASPVGVIGPIERMRVALWCGTLGIIIGFVVAIAGSLVLGVGVSCALSASLSLASLTVSLATVESAHSAIPTWWLGFAALLSGMMTALPIIPSRVGGGELSGFWLRLLALSIGCGLAFALVSWWSLGVIQLTVAPADALRMGVLFAAGFFLASTGLVAYPAAALAELALLGLQNALKTSTLRCCPVLFHDDIRLPLPGLRRHLVNSLDLDPSLVLRVSERCERLQVQRGALRGLMQHVEAQELGALLDARDFARAIDRLGQSELGWRATLREAIRYTQAAQATATPYLRLRNLRNGGEWLAVVQKQVRTEQPELAARLHPALSRLSDALADWRRQAEEGVSRQLPNPFRAGDPLTPDQGREVFRGRESIVVTIESSLSEAGSGFSLALLGPRRCGKTSLLRMLPVLLPDALCLFFDLQAIPIDSAESFFRVVAERASLQGAREHRASIPTLGRGPVFEAAERWFDDLERLGQNSRILLCFDEFESLEAGFASSVPELRRLLGLLRGVVQHRRFVRLLICGAVPFDELGDIWNEYFINLREVQIGHLEESLAVDLLTRPITEFPRSAISTEVAWQIVKRTGSQPFLLQLYGSLLVNYLNEEGRLQSRLDDLAFIDDQVLASGRPYFANIFRSAPSEVRSLLVAIAGGWKPTLATTGMAWLRRRRLVEPEGTLSIPILGNWIREEFDNVTRS